MKAVIISVTTCLILCSSSGCKKFVDVDTPVTNIEGSAVYQKDATAIAVLTGVYMKMNNPSSFATGSSSISVIAGLSADEFIAYAGAQLTSAYKNALTSAPSPGVPFWSTIYNLIYTANTALQGLSESATLTPSVKQRLLGEAKFARAFLYFYLINLWGDVPLVVTNDYLVNSIMARTEKLQVYQQIIKDLKDAKELLSADFLKSDLLTVTNERSRPNKWAACALLARTYLFTGDWANAETEANNVISNTALFDTVSLNNVFLKNSKEAIWQLQPTSPGWNTEDAKAFILTAVPGSIQYVSLSSQIINAFESADNRKQSWVKNFTSGTSVYYYPYKYKVYTQNAPLSEYLMVLRLGEQYLIRAEARAQQENIAGAQADLNVIRKRAGLPNASANDKASILAAILHERQVELFSEWGHRWLDLKRSEVVNSVMSAVAPLKGGIWQPEWALYPLPQIEIQRNLALQQNPGYQ